LLLDSYNINIIIHTSRLNYPEFQTTQEYSVSRFIINRHKISEKGCLKNQFFKAQINKPIYLTFLLHNQEITNKITQGKVKM
jgi:hypothetical protein